MNIKKIRTLGLIFVLSFPMLYLPLLVNNLNGTYNDEQKDQLLLSSYDTDLNRPLITRPLLQQWSDNYFKAMFSVTNSFLLNNHVFRVYAYIDYNRQSDTDDGDKFSDGSSHKKRGPFRWCIPADDDPYTEVPFSSSLNPKESFMGERRKWTHDGQQEPIIDDYYCEWDNPLASNHNPGPINLVIQVLWAHDTFDVWEDCWTDFLGIEWCIYKPCKYYRHFYWETKVYSYDLLLREMEIYDDDPEPPIIPTETEVPLPFDPIKLQPFILDNMPTFPLEVCAYDLGASGPHPYNTITFGSVNVYNGEYLSGEDELIEWGGLYGDDIYAYWYKYDIPNNYEPGTHTLTLHVWDKDYDGWAGDRLSDSHEVTFTVIDDDTSKPTIDYEYTGDGTDGNPGALIVTASDASGLSVDPSGTYPVPNSLGTHYFTFTATDNDNDREDDRLTRTINVPIEIVDDDILGPEINHIYTGDGTDGNPGFINVTASDPSGLSVDPSGQYPVSNILGTYDFTFTATDNDNDREGEDDTSTETLDVSIEIVDDDIEEPYFENIDVTDDCNWLNIRFHGLDELLGDDEGLSLIEIFVDDELIHSYIPSPTDTIFDFGFENKWIWEVSDEYYSNGQITYEIRVKITDADDDRVGVHDELTAEFIRYFEVTLDEMYDYVIWLLGEVNEYIYDNSLVALYGTVTQKLVRVQDILVDAYQLIEAGAIHTGLVRNKIAEAKLEIAEAKAELKSFKGQIGEPYTSEILSMMHNIRNKIVELMGRSVRTEFSHDISLVEIDLYNLRDFVEDNINATDSENLVNAITLTAEKLENAIFDISLDKATEGSLTSALNALDKVRTEVAALARKVKISDELAFELQGKIIIIQSKINSLIPEI